MADTKISALSSATTPLAGTEVAPIVQSSATVKATVESIATATQPSGTANGVQYLNGSKVPTTGSALVFDGVNLGIGITPSAWGTASSSKAQQIGTSLSFLSFGSSGQGAHIAGNTYWDGTNWRYLNSTGAVRYEFDNAGYSHKWYNAPYGTAGGTISWTQAMTLDSSNNLTLNVGNLIQGTAAKGINFTANTPAAGMTSQLLNWYEEGTWTATLATGFTTTPTTTGYYTRIGKQVTITLVGSFGVIVNNGAAITITGVPFAAANPVDAVMSGQRIAFNSNNAPFIQLSGTTISFYEVVPSSPTVNALTSSSGAGNAPVLGNISITYFV